MVEEKVLKFISGFKSVKDFFLFGYCYWFAYILAEQFGGEIYYIPIQNHFVTCIKGRFYDAGGIVIVRADEIVKWSDFTDLSERKRIIRDCINKE